MADHQHAFYLTEIGLVPERCPSCAYAWVNVDFDTPVGIIQNG